MSKFAELIHQSKNPEDQLHRYESVKCAFRDLVVGQVMAKEMLKSAVSQDMGSESTEWLKDKSKGNLSKLKKVKKMTTEKKLNNLGKATKETPEFKSDMPKTAARLSTKRVQAALSAAERRLGDFKKLQGIGGTAGQQAGQQAGKTVRQIEAVNKKLLSDYPAGQIPAEIQEQMRRAEDLLGKTRRFASKKDISRAQGKGKGARLPKPLIYGGGGIAVLGGGAVASRQKAPKEQYNQYYQ